METIVAGIAWFVLLALLALAGTVGWAVSSYAHSRYADTLAPRLPPPPKVAVVLRGKPTGTPAMPSHVRVTATPATPVQVERDLIWNVRWPVNG